MRVRYENQQDDLDPMNGAVIAGSRQLVELLKSRRGKPPFFARFFSDNGFEIMVGIGGDVGCVQYSRSDGKAPFLMAVSAQPAMKSGYFEFLTADTLTPCAARYIISFPEVEMITLHFLDTGERSNAVLWQSLDPKAIFEDAKPGNLH